MAPAANKTRRSRPAVSARASTIGLVQLVLAGAAWLLAIGRLAAPRLSMVRIEWQPLAWVPDWAWLIAVGVSGIAGALLAIGAPSRRGIRAIVCLAAIIGPASGVLRHDFGWSGAGPDPRLRVVFLNAQSPSEPEAAIALDAILGRRPDLVVVVNPGWIAPVWRRRLADPGDGTRGPGEWSVQWRSPVLVASPFGGCRLRTLVAAGDVRAVGVGLPASLADRLGWSGLLVVDLPSDPDLDREVVADRLLDGLATAGVDLADQGLVLGDFNMTPRTPALGRLRSGLRDLVSDHGAGWTATWPRERPLLRIDQVLGDLDGDIRIETFDPGAGGHRGFVIDLPIDPGQPEG